MPPTSASRQSRSVCCTQSPPRALEQAGGRLLVSAQVRRVTAEREVLLDDGAQQADAVILAVPHEAVSRLAPAGTADEKALSDLGTSPIVNLHVHYDRPVLEDRVAAAVGSPVQWLFDRTAASGATEGQLVAVSLSHAVDEIGASVAELRARFVPALERVLPAARSARILDFAVTHEPRATFRAAPGTAALRPGARTPVAGVYLAGAWTSTGWPATMESAVRSGLAAAEAALADRANDRSREAKEAA
jgi:uncharacterized protein with NAD-binding domain and iron-sulfur cluster